MKSTLEGYVSRCGGDVKLLLEYLGVDSIEQVQDLLRRQLGEGLTESNYGTEWEIDHIYPIKEEGLSFEEQLKRLNAYNLAPLFKVVNRKKSNKVLFDQPYDEFIRDRKLMFENEGHHCTSVIIRDKLNEFRNR
jgi:hypothetical protein